MAGQESSASERGARLSTRRKVDYGVFRIADILVMQNMALYVTTYYTIIWMIPPAWLKWAKPLIKVFDGNER